MLFCIKHKTKQVKSRCFCVILTQHQTSLMHVIECVSFEHIEKHMMPIFPNSSERVKKNRKYGTMYIDLTDVSFKINSCPTFFFFYLSG